MERLIELGQLLDWYGAFLTERQRSLMRQYAFEDCSLGEIAEREGISRQAVCDALKKARSQLGAMEDRLGLIRKNARMRDILAALQETAQDDKQRALIEELIELTTEDGDGV